MLFNSIEFAIFLPIVFLVYWFVLKGNRKGQNTFIFAVSYFFYGWWDWRFLFLLLFSTLLDYFTALKINASNKRRERMFWFYLSICVNLGFLGIFKYYNFFVESLADFLYSFGIQPNLWTLKVILPVGISFYTFHGLSYVIDIYKGRIQPSTSFIDYAVFVSIFPLLVAGPIERANHLLPQFYQQRTFDYKRAVDGMKLILWGLLKKVAIADVCANNVDYIFGNYETLPSMILLLGAIHFAFQIYCDFSGYSDIAIGTAKLFGFDLLRNFNYPYLSRDIAEFWRKWHMSLTSWFRDYIYIPLGGSRVNKALQIRNTFIIFAISGFWHGANWTFIVWGLLNAIYFIPLLLFNKNRKNIDVIDIERQFPTIKELIQIVITFSLVLIGWIFFRAADVAEGWAYLTKIFKGNFLNFSILNLRGRGISDSLVQGSVGIVILMVLEWTQRDKQCPIEFSTYPRWVKWNLYWMLCFVLFFMAGKEKSFIYFQF
jgi:D-alanyl-lipoteichoic acid acyltransferase DltB (MBOAT superfamily)